MNSWIQNAWLRRSASLGTAGFSMAHAFGTRPFSVLCESAGARHCASKVLHDLWRFSARCAAAGATGMVVYGPQVVVSRPDARAAWAPS